MSASMSWLGVGTPLQSLETAVAPLDAVVPLWLAQAARKITNNAAVTINRIFPVFIS
jgi:hypothetical protein